MESTTQATVYNEKIQYGDAVVAQFRGVYPGARPSSVCNTEYLALFQSLYRSSCFHSCKLLTLLLSNQLEQKEFVTAVELARCRKHCHPFPVDNDTTDGVYRCIVELQETTGFFSNVTLLTGTNNNIPSLLLYESDTAVLLNCNVSLQQFGELLHGQNFMDKLFDDYCYNTGHDGMSRGCFDEAVSLLDETSVTLLLVPGTNVFYHFKARTFVNRASVAGLSAGINSNEQVIKKRKVADVLDLQRIDEMLFLLTALVPLPLHWLRLDLHNDPVQYAKCVVDLVNYAIQVKLDAPATFPPPPSPPASVIPTYSGKHYSPFNRDCPFIEGKFPRRIFQQAIRDPNCQHVGEQSLRVHHQQLCYASADILQDACCAHR